MRNLLMYLCTDVCAASEQRSYTLHLNPKQPKPLNLTAQAQLRPKALFQAEAE